MVFTPLPTSSSRRAGRRREDVLRAARLVIAQRGVEETRFADVSAASGVPISTLQYYFGNREDLIVAAFRHEVQGELSALSELVLTPEPDPWGRLVALLRLGIVDGERSATAWGTWLEFWRASLRDEELRQEAHSAYLAWRNLVAGVVREGLAVGRFHTDLDPDEVGRLIVALIDGIGIPVALADPGLPAAEGAATRLVERAVERLLQVRADESVTGPG